MVRESSIPTLSTTALLAEGTRLGARVDDLEARRVEGTVDSRVPLDLHLSILVDLIERTGDRALHARVAASRPAQKYGILGFLAMTQQDVGHGLAAAARHLAFWLVGPALHVRTTEDGGLAIRVEVPERVAHAGTLTCDLVIEISLAGLVGAGRTFGSTRWSPARLDVPSEASRDVLRDVLGTDVGAGEPLLVVDPATCRLPCRHAQPEMAAYFEEALRAARVAGDRAHHVQDAVREQLVPRLAHGNTAIGDIAPRLGMSIRTLQRELAAEGTTYARVRDDLRRAMALRLLGIPELPVDSVATVLGYDEAASFLRAFRRWVGRTPTEWRRQISG